MNKRSFERDESEKTKKQEIGPENSCTSHAFEITKRERERIFSIQRVLILTKYDTTIVFQSSITAKTRMYFHDLNSLLGYTCR